MLPETCTKRWSLKNYVGSPCAVFDVCCNLSFKCVKGLAPSYLIDRLAERYFVHDRNVRNKNSLNIQAYRSASGIAHIFISRYHLLELYCTCFLIAAPFAFLRKIWRNVLKYILGPVYANAFSKTFCIWPSTKRSERGVCKNEGPRKLLPLFRRSVMVFGRQACALGQKIDWA